jgi:hypothetical protein
MCFVDRCLKIPKELSESVDRRTDKTMYTTKSILVDVLSILLRYTDSDCPFGIFKLFIRQKGISYGCKLSIKPNKPAHLVNNRPSVLAWQIIMNTRILKEDVL